MADANFTVYNDAGIEQVSFGGINLALIDKRIIPANVFNNVPASRSNGLVYNFTITAVNPVVAIATDNTGAKGAVYPQVKNNGNGTWTITLWGGASMPSFSAGGAPTLIGNVAVYTFDKPPAPISGAIPGLALYDAQGNCTFNAMVPGIRVKQMLDNANNLHGYGTSLTPPSGKTYAWVLRSSWGQMFIEAYNNQTGDKLVFDWRIGFSGGLSGAAVAEPFYSPNICSCLLQTGMSTRAGSSTAPGSIYLTHGCKAPTGALYFSDAMVLDVTGL